MTRTCTFAALLIGITAASWASLAQAGDSIQNQGEMHIVTLHAQGAQIYECKGETLGSLRWEFREPVATLMENGQTVGRHYAGPSWELADGSTIIGKVVGRAPGASAGDIAHLNLEVVARRGAGRLSEVTTIQRLDTKGGVKIGACEKSGALVSVPYAADYVLIKKSR